MGLGKKTIDDQNYCGKKMLVRCDFNVPMKDGVITNENRINAALPTIQKLVNDGAKVILCSTEQIWQASLFFMIYDS